MADNTGGMLKHRRVRDEALDSDVGRRPEAGRVESAYLNDLKRVAGKTRILYRVADAALEHPDEPVREVVFPVANEQTLRDLVAEAGHFPTV